ncbi:hypothetical protein DIS24_g517 [Lasiodiplodia hormozganensis]|uniref:Prion-inhibition and propagation HeLo domain-containing protein n=1 Tax=Lasiodiplodia hormozganensis TaxID=869390 RepID=A0AA39Z4U5_9PEZI|nr:hypothetical protein DIS24_g517 [Lasiodiplodia hormozganensis]
MSGIEVAGLVLGALPLIVEALKAYSNGISTIGTYLRYELPLKTLHMDLSVEYTLYQNACERLLEGLVDDNDEREALLQEPGGRAWRNPDLERKLQQRLSKTYSIFNDIMQEIHLAVLKIKELLRFDSDGKVWYFQFIPI